MIFADMGAIAMDMLDGIRAFVAVAESGSFTAAGHHLGISNKLAGKYLAELEARLGKTLLYRTTRAVSLSDEGARWLPHARRVLAAVEEAEAALQPGAGGPSGTLRLTCGTTLGELVLAQALQAFLDAYPAMRAELHLSDGFTDLAAGGFDLAVRIGLAQDSSLRMRRITGTRMRIAASPAYLARHGRPETPADLADHQAVLDLNDRMLGRWPLSDAAGQIRHVTVGGRLAVNSAALTIRAALQGQGLVRAPDLFLAPYLRDGRLVELLQDYTGTEYPLHLLMPPTAHRLDRVDAFAKVLTRHLAQLQAGGPAPAPGPGPGPGPT